MCSELEASLCRRVDLQPTEILIKVFLPFTQNLEYVKEFKQAHRRDDDIAIANAGMRVRLKHTTDGQLRAGPFSPCSTVTTLMLLPCTFAAVSKCYHGRLLCVSCCAAC